MTPSPRPLHSSSHVTVGCRVRATAVVFLFLSILGLFLVVTRQAWAVNDGFEPNDSVSSATAVPVPWSGTGLFIESWDEDYFAFECGTGTATVSLHVVPTNQVLLMEVLEKGASGRWNPVQGKTLTSDQFGNAKLALAAMSSNSYCVHNLKARATRLRLPTNSSSKSSSR